MIEKVIFINTPKLFSAIIAILKMFIKKKTSDKFVVLGENYKSELIKNVQMAKIPKEFGGKEEFPLDKHPMTLQF